MVVLHRDGCVRIESPRFQESTYRLDNQDVPHARPRDNDSVEGTHRVWQGWTLVCVCMVESVDCLHSYGLGRRRKCSWIGRIRQHI